MNGPTATKGGDAATGRATSGAARPAPAGGTGAGGDAAAGRRRPWVKLCGVTRPEDAVRAVELGADMIGLNFHPPSPRCLSAERAKEIAEAVRATTDGRDVRLVGVFVDLSREEIDALDRAIGDEGSPGLDLVQLHGDPTPAGAAPFGDRALVVTRVPATDPPTAAALTDHLAAFPDAWGFLFDVRHDELWGGSGESFGWELLAGIDRERLGHRPLLVAGGITPDNAARAVARSGADGVDVASGVESAPGVKDPELLRLLLEGLLAAPEPRPVSEPA